MKDEHVGEEYTQPVAVESEDVKREMDKLQFPQIEGDLAPSALVPKACQSLQKQVAKLDSLLESAKAVDRLTPLQSRRLVTNWYQMGTKILGQTEWFGRLKCLYFGEYDVNILSSVSFSIL